MVIFWMTCPCVQIKSFWGKKEIKKTLPQNLPQPSVFTFFIHHIFFLFLLKVYPVDFILAKNELSELWRLPWLFTSKVLQINFLTN